MKNKLILWVILLGAGFLLGFIPQFSKSRRLEGELQTARQQLAAHELNSNLCRFRDLAATAYLEAARRNYGLASDTAYEFFDEVRRFAAATDPELKRNLEGLLVRRDAISAGLAKADPAVLPELEALVLETQRKAKR